MSKSDDRDAIRRKALPYVVVGLTVATYVLIRNAGHSGDKAMLVAFIMLAMCGFGIMVHHTLGSMKGGIFLMVLSALGAMAQYFGWL